MHHCSQQQSHPADYPSPGTDVPLLHQVVHDYVGSFVTLCNEEGRTLQPFIMREFEKFIECQDFNVGYAEVLCPDCGDRRAVPFSCKGRAWCPHCLVRRMCDRGAFLTDNVFGDTPVRHFTLSFPPPLRYLLLYDHSLVTELLHSFMDALFRHLRWKAKKVLGLSSVAHAYPGAVTVIQRCSGNLGSNCHFHTLGTDGVFVCETPDGPVSFRELPPPTDEEIAAIATEVCCRARDILKRRGLWEDIVEDGRQDSVDAGESTQSHSPTIHGFLSMGPQRGRREVRYFGRATRREDEPTVTGQIGYSFDLYGRRAVTRGDRKELEELAKYILSPPITDEQLSRGPDGRVVLDLKRSRRDGTKQVVFEPLEFLDKLAALVPRPRANTVRFHGVYASNARLRDQALPKQVRPRGETGSRDPLDGSRRLTWAELLARTYSEDLFRCPRCHSRARVVIWIVDRHGEKTLLREVTPPDPPTDAD